MSQWRERKRFGSRWIGWIAPDLSMDPKHFFRAIVVGRQFPVPDRPSRRGTFVVSKRFKVLFAETRKRCAVDFSVASNEVVHAGAKWLSRIIMPEFSCFVSLAVEYRFRTPILRFFRKKIATLQQEDFSAGIAQSICQRTSAHPGPDNDQIESVHS